MSTGKRVQLLCHASQTAELSPFLSPFPFQFLLSVFVLPLGITVLNIVIMSFLSYHFSVCLISILNINDSINHIFLNTGHLDGKRIKWVVQLE